MTTISENYMSYQNMVNCVTGSMANVGEVCEVLPLETHAKTLRENREKMQNRVFSVGIMGEFKRGKSTVINALLGKKIVPADVLPCTATPNYIRWDAVPHAQVKYMDGTLQDVPVDELSQYITKITEEYGETAATVDSSYVYYPCDFCQNGVEIVDTPGMNDDERMTAISEQIIPSLDAIIMVVVPGSPFSQSEADFVRNKVMTSDLGRIIFVVNKIDTVDEDDQARLLDSIRAKIEHSVLDKIESMYGKDSREYEDARDKIGGIRLYGISALNALKGKMKNDEEMVRKSGFLSFEEALARLLTEERGLLELINPVNTVCSIAMEAKNAINMRISAEQMSLQEFKQMQKESMEKIEKSREAERKKVKEIKNRAANLYVELLPQVSDYYSSIEQELLTEAEHVDITALIQNTNAANGDNPAWNAIVTKMNRRLETKLSEAAEKLSVLIQNRISDEIVDIRDFVSAFHADLENLNELTAASAKKTKGDLVSAAVEIGANLVFADWIVGLGGAIAGWKINGMPGALLGGGAGALAGLGAATVLLGLGFVGLPLIVGAGLAGTYGGKWAVNLAFKNKIQQKRAEEARETLYSNVRSAISQMRKKQVLESWLRESVDDAYKKLSDTLQNQLEASLNSMEETMTQIQVEMTKSQMEKETHMKEMENLIEKLNSVFETITPVKQRLNAMLNA